MYAPEAISDLSGLGDRLGSGRWYLCGKHIVKSQAEQCALYQLM